MFARRVDAHGFAAHRGALAIAQNLTDHAVFKDDRAVGDHVPGDGVDGRVFDDHWLRLRRRLVAQILRGGGRAQKRCRHGAGNDSCGVFHEMVRLLKKNVH